MRSFVLTLMLLSGIVVAQSAQADTAASKDHPLTGMNFYVVGHTDSTGRFAYNTALSRDRAGAVVDALSNDHGIDRKRLERHGVGPLNPVFSNDTDAGKTKNRRVELVQQ